MPSIKIDFNEIRELIPHREPFLFLDELVDIIRLKKATGIKVFSKNDYLQLKYFRNMHRFLPALFKINSGKIFNVPVDDRKRTNGISKYSFHNRFWIGILDLINVWLMILKRRKKWV